MLIRVVKKYYRLLTRSQLAKVFGLAFLMILGGLLETISVSLVYPFIDSIMSPNDLMDKWYAAMACKYLKIDSSKDFLVILGLLLAGLYIFKNLYLVIEYGIQYKFVYGSMLQMQKKLLSEYMNRPYEFFLHINSGEVIRLLNNDTPNTYETMMVVLGLFTETTVAAMLFLTIVLIAPVMSLTVAIVLFTLSFVILLFIKPVLYKCGKKDIEALSGMNKWLLQCIQGIKEIKVMRGESFFQKQYDSYGDKHVITLRKSRILNLMPRFMIEGICMASMFVAVTIMILNGGDVRQIVPIVSVIAVAATRLLPSVNRISSALGNISFNEPMLDKLIENLNDEHSNPATQPVDCSTRESSGFVFERDIELKNISYKYPKTDNLVLNDISIDIKKGESVGIVGASGSGKTTFVDIILGLLRPVCGHVFVDGMDVSDNLRAWYKCIGYIPQSIFMLDGTIKDNVSFGETNNDDARVIKALEEASLGEFIESLPQGIYTEIGERGLRISGGQKQRIGIARALYQNPDVLFFDEATSALDNDTESSIMDSIHRLQGKKTMIIIAHRLTTIEKCDHIFKVENGKITRLR